MEQLYKKDIPYFLTPNTIFEIGLNPYQIAVYSYLSRCSNNGRAAFPSFKTISEKCGMSKRKAMDTVQELIDKSLLIKTTRKDGNSNESNLYEVVHDMHQGSAQCALGVVHDMHQGSACGAPYKEIDINKNTIYTLDQDNHQSNHQQTIESSQVEEDNHQQNNHHTFIDTIKDGKGRFLEFVYLTSKEHDALITKLGKDATDMYIERLNNYIGQIGEVKAKKKYISHYHVILNWRNKDEKEKVKQFPKDKSNGGKAANIPFRN